MITVFTPTYNRAYLIGNLYQSLCIQTYSDFEWLIVDDGSTDDTQLLVQSFVEEQKIQIRYIKQVNGGKHRAINRGLGEAHGDLFFIVDSDDQLSSDALEQISHHYGGIDNIADFAGVCGVKASLDGQSVNSGFGKGVLECTLLEFRFKYHVVGDMAEVFRTEVLRKFPFPEFDGEFFCPEALVWNRIAGQYKMRYFNKNIYIAEYLPDGLTSKIVQIRMKSPEASKLYYSELYRSRVPMCSKVKAAINYWRFAYCSRSPFMGKIKQIGPLAVLAYPVGVLYHFKDLFVK